MDGVPGAQASALAPRAAKERGPKGQGGAGRACRVRRTPIWAGALESSQETRTGPTEAPARGQQAQAGVLGAQETGASHGCWPPRGRSPSPKLCSPSDSPGQTAGWHTPQQEPAALAWLGTDRQDHLLIENRRRTRAGAAGAGKPSPSRAPPQRLLEGCMGRAPSASGVEAADHTPGATGPLLEPKKWLLGPRG